MNTNNKKDLVISKSGNHTENTSLHVRDGDISSTFLFRPCFFICLFMIETDLFPCDIAVQQVKIVTIGYRTAHEDGFSSVMFSDRRRLICYHHPMKFFIASPWQNTEIVKSLSVALAARGHEVYSFLDNGANAVGGAPPIEESEESFPNSILSWENNPAVKEIFESDMKALKESDVVILLEPSGRSSLAEAGIAYGMGKKIVVVGRVAHPSIVLYSISKDRYANTDDFLVSLGGVVA